MDPSIYCSSVFNSQDMENTLYNIQRFSSQESFTHLYYFANALVSLCLKICNYRNGEGFPWQSSGQDSMLPLQGAQVQSLVRERRTHMLRSAACVCVCVYTYIHTCIYTYMKWRRTGIDTFTIYFDPLPLHSRRIYQGCLLCH